MSKTFGQKVAYAFSILSAVGAVACALGAVVYRPESAADAIRPSLLASVVFFVGTALVLHVIANARLKGLLATDGTAPTAPAAQQRGETET